MSNVVRFPVIPRPIPAEPFEAGDDPFVNAKKALDVWEKYVLKHCGADWTAKVLEDRLWRARARRELEKQS